MSESTNNRMRVRASLILIIVLVISAGLTAWRSESLIEQVMLDRTKYDVTRFLTAIEQRAQQKGDLLDADMMQIVLSDTLRDESDALGFSIRQLYAYDPSGKVYAWIGDKEKPRPLDGHYGDVLRQDRPYLGDEIEKSINRISGVPQHFTDIIIPLHQNGKVVAGLEAEINVDATMKQIEHLDNGYERDVLFVVIGSLLAALGLIWIALRRP